VKELKPEEVESLTLGALERIAFVLADSVREAEATFDRHTRIEYAGNGESSQIQLSATDGFLIEFVSSLLGLEPESIEPAVQGQQALNELANIIAGEVIAKLGGGEIQFDLGLPSTIESAIADAWEADLRCRFKVEDGCLEVAIQRESI